MTEKYPQILLREFKGLKQLADGALVQLETKEFFAVPGIGDNSAAVIVKHVSGNLVSRWTDFLTSDGEKPNRDRDGEFEIVSEDTREALLRAWERAWPILFAAIEPLTSADFERTVVIRGEPLSVLQAINRQLTHYAYHVGQIVYVAKHWRGSAWRTLSIPVGQSKQFNAAPAPYVRPR